MTKKKNFLALVADEKADTLKKNRARIKNRAMLRESQQIAMKVLEKLDVLRWSQKELAKRMGVSPQQISKIVSGKENLTIETQIKLQNMLDIPILASYYENRSGETDECILSVERRVENIVVQDFVEMSYPEAKAVGMEKGGHAPMCIQSVIG